METNVKNVRVSYNFYLPENEEELNTFQKATDMEIALLKIHDRCRYQWKYNENATEELVAFAEEISEICYEFMD